MEKTQLSYRLKRAFCYSLFVRYWRSAKMLFSHIRLSLSSVIVGSLDQVAMGKSVILSQGVKIDVGRHGKVALRQNVWLGKDTELETENLVDIGENTSIQRRCSINGDVKIGRDCIFAPNVFVSSGSHIFRAIPFLPIREQDALLSAESKNVTVTDCVNKPVWIQDDCWIGINVVVCPGVTIGKGSVIGANSVVTSNVRPYAVLAGSPAREIGSRLDWNPPLIIDASNEKDRVYVLTGCKNYQHNEANFFEANIDYPFIAIVSAKVKSIKVYLSIKSHIKVFVGLERTLVDVYDGVLDYDLQFTQLMHQGRAIQMSLSGNNPKLILISKIVCS